MNSRYLLAWAEISPRTKISKLWRSKFPFSFHSLMHLSVSSKLWYFFRTTLSRSISSMIWGVCPYLLSRLGEALSDWSFARADANNWLLIADILSIKIAITLRLLLSIGTNYFKGFGVWGLGFGVWGLGFG